MCEPPASLRKKLDIKPKPVEGANPVGASGAAIRFVLDEAHQRYRSNCPPFLVPLPLSTIKQSFHSLSEKTEFLRGVVVF